jgi:metal-dependent hydrolase (beta-lactamase superfamily II)
MVSSQELLLSMRGGRQATSGIEKHRASYPRGIPLRYQARDFGAAEQLVAEHGFSTLVSVERDGGRRTVLYDAGLTPHALARNLDVLQVPVSDLRAIVISHGHADHHGGLEGLLRRRGRSRLPLVIHPDAWRERRVVFPSGGEVRLPPPSRQDLEAEGLEVVEERAHSLLLDGAAGSRLSRQRLSPRCRDCFGACGCPAIG